MLVRLEVIFHSPQISNISSSPLSSDLNGNFQKSPQSLNDQHTPIHIHCLQGPCPWVSFKVSLVHTMQNCSSHTSVKFLTALQLLMKFNGRLG